MKFVVDASVAIKWFIPEVHSVAAARLLHSRFHVLAPDLIHPELGNILWKKTRREEITHRNVLEILTAFKTVGIEVHPSAVLLVPAFEIAASLDRTVYDSLYLALAVEQDCALITADQKFYSVVATSSLANHIRWVEDDLTDFVS
jgi:predicted nucleic acid-binding protein